LIGFLDLEDYFPYWEINDKEKVRPVSNKLVSDAVKWGVEKQEDRVC
jgi:hypothetical protein